MTNQPNTHSVSRRRFLKGAGGAALSLPWLEKAERCLDRELQRVAR